MNKILVRLKLSLLRVKTIIGAWPEWIGLVLVLVTLGIAIRCVQESHWITPQPSFITVLFLSMVVGVILTKSRWPLLVSITMFILSGLIVSLWQASQVIPSPEASSIFERVSGSINILWQTLSQSTPNEGTIYFALLLIILSWLTGYLATWFFLRKSQVWQAITLGLLIILINLEYLNPGYYGYFFYYIFSSLLLICYVNFIKQRLIFTKRNTRFPLKNIIWSGVIVLVVSSVLSGVNWAAPEIHANQLQALTESKIQPGQVLNDLKLNFFAAVKAKGTIIKSTDQGSLFFSTPPNLSEAVQFIIDSPSAPSYWRVKRYDVYNPWGWSTSPAVDSIFDSNKEAPQLAVNVSVSQLTYTVTDKIKTDIALIAGQLSSSTVPLKVQVFAPGSTAGGVMAAASQTGLDDKTMAITTPHLYKPDEGYTITVDIVKPSAEQLKAAGNKYPEWIASQFLQLPSTLPQSVKSISRNITRNSPTSFEKVKSVLDYLSHLKYVAEGTMPPTGTDAVEDFLINTKTGNCTNFATAAVVLLRTTGIPARFCTGYITQPVDKSTGKFLVKARDYHAWIEVYFPNYGWVEFETTPGVSTDTGSQDVVTDNSATLNSGFNSIPNYFPSYEFPTPTFPTDSSSTSNPVETKGNLYLTLLLPMTFVVAITVLILIWIQRFKRRDYISEIFARLYFIAPLVGISPSTRLTPSEFERKLISALPEQKNAINYLTRAFLENRFNRKKIITIDEENILRSSWRLVLSGIIKRRLFRF